MANDTVFVFIDDEGSLYKETVGLGVESTAIRVADELVAAYVRWEDPPGVTQRSQRQIGAADIGCFIDANGRTVFRRLVKSGPGNQQGCKQASYKANAGAKALPDIDLETAEPAMSVGLCWPVFKGGTGNQYDAALAASDRLAGWPFGTDPI